MSKLKVLIADDSLIYRSQIKAALNDIEWLEIVGVASNGKIAIEKIKQGHVDLLILDIEMPEMNGIQTLREIKRSGASCRVLVFSGTSRAGAEGTLEALALGASDFITKPGASTDSETEPSLKIRSALEPKIKALFPGFDLKSTTSAMAPAHSSQRTEYPRIIWDLFNPSAIVIGCSTGGPTVLEQIFSAIAPPLRCPIFIAQHMPPVFTATLAARLQKMSHISVVEAVDGTQVNSNTVYVAPGDYHMTIAGTRERPTISLNQGAQINSVRPAVDPLFESAAQLYQDKCLGIILTGMGADGKVGAEKIKKAGGMIIIQSESSCVVFGMPGAVFSSGAYDKIMKPQEIIAALHEKTAGVQPTFHKENANG